MSAPVEPRRDGRRSLGAAVVLAALLVVVALASRGQLGGDGRTAGRGRPGLPAGAFAYVYAGLLVAGVLALPFFFYIYARDTPYSAVAPAAGPAGPVRARRPSPRSALFVATRWGDELRELSSGSAPGRRRRRRRRTRATRRARPQPEWMPLVVTTSVARRRRSGRVLALAAWRAGACARRRSPRRSPTRSTTRSTTSAPSPTRGARSSSRTPAWRPRSTARGAPRHEAEAPLEYLARVLCELEVEPAPGRTR